MIGAFSTAGLFMTDATVAGGDKIRCDACPVMCYIKPGAAGACDRYANHNGELVRVDPHIVLERTVSHGGRLVPFQAGGDWDGKIVHEPNVFVTAIGAGTTYPDYKPVELTIDGGATVVVQAGYPPIVNGVAEERMRVGCGSATIGMFAKQWHGKVDEVVVVDDHITGVLSEHQAGKLLDIADTGIKMKGRRSTPGRYFQVAEPGTGWGGTKISDPLSVLGPFDAKKARPGVTMLMVSTTGEHAAFYELDEALKPVEKPLPADLRSSVERIQENCEPALCTVLFMGGAGGSLRAGVTDNPVRLTRSVKEALTLVTSGGAPVYVWPGGGITFMVDVTRLPAGAFGYVPTPALVAPIEFTLRLSDYAALGGHMDHVRPLASLTDNTETRQTPSLHSAPGRRA